MKKNQYAEEQIVRILRETDCAPVTELAKSHGARSPFMLGDEIALPPLIQFFLFNKTLIITC